MFNLNESFHRLRQGLFEMRAPSAEDIRNAFEILGLPNGDKTDLIKNYKLLARKHHPDLNQGDDVMMKKINWAKDVLDQVAGSGKTWTPPSRAEMEEFKKAQLALYKKLASDVAKLLDRSADAYEKHFGKFIEGIKAKPAVPVPWNNDHYATVKGEWSNSEKTTVFHIDIQLSNRDGGGSLGMGSSDENYQILWTTSMLHDGRTYKVGTSRHVFNKVSGQILDPSEAFPEKAMKRVASKKRASSKMQPRDFVAILQNQFGAMFSGKEYLYIPFNETQALQLFRSAFLRKASWGILGIIEKNEAGYYTKKIPGKFGYKSLVEDEKTIDLLKAIIDLLKAGKVDAAGDLAQSYKYESRTRLFNLIEAKARLNAGYKRLNEMKIPLQEVKVSYRDILKWNKDFDAILEAFREQNYSDLDSAIIGTKKVQGYFRVFLKNLKTYVNRDLWTVVDLHLAGYEASKIKDARTRLALAYKEFEDAVIDLIEYTDPSRYKHGSYQLQDINNRIDWYVNGQFRDSTKHSRDIKAEKTGDKLFKAMRELVSTYSSGEREAEFKVYYPETANFMGFTFVNNIFYPEEDLQRMFGFMGPPLRSLKRLMPEVFYGQIFMEPQGHDQKNIQVGKMTIDAGGTYTTSSDRVTLYAKGLKEWITSASTVIVHELAHRYYFKFMTLADRRRWEDFFERLKTQGASEYGDQNPEEDFAECITHYVFGKGVMKKSDVRDRVEAILNRRLRESKKLTESDGAEYQKKAKIEVWRAISIDKPEVAKKIKALGIFWTDEKDKAKTYWGDKKPYYVVFRAIVTQDQIDHEKTLEMRNSNFAGEDEIRLKSFQNIVVKDAEIYKYLSRAEYMAKLGDGTAGKPIEVISINSYRSSGKSNVV